MRGFTLTELLISIAISFVLMVSAVSVYGQLQVKAQLSETSAQIVQTLRIARENSLARYRNSASGVFFKINPTEVSSYTLYLGSAYTTRNTAYDRVQNLDQVIKIVNNSFLLNQGDIDVNFSPGLGMPSNIGTLFLVHQFQGTSTINVNGQGKIESVVVPQL